MPEEQKLVRQSNKATKLNVGPISIDRFVSDDQGPQLYLQAFCKSLFYKSKFKEIEIVVV